MHYLCGMEIAILVVCVCVARLRPDSESSLSTTFMFQTQEPIQFKFGGPSLVGSMLVI